MNRSANGTSLSEPNFHADTQPLIKKLRGFGKRKLSKLMNISAELAHTNMERYAAWRENPNSDNTAAAMLAFSGDVYRGMENHTLAAEDLDFANEHIRILSGMYGILRPLDGIQAHRLEMGTSINVGRKKNLYEYWRPKVAEHLNAILKEREHKVIVNLASTEYSKVIDESKVDARIITPIFKDLKNGEYKVVMTWAKLARGMMTRFIIENRIEDPEELKGFGPYQFNESDSDDLNWIFTRDDQTNGLIA